MKNLRFEEVLKGMREGKRFSRETFSSSVNDNITNRLYNLDRIYIEIQKQMNVDFIYLIENGKKSKWTPTQDDIMENDWYEYSAY